MFGRLKHAMRKILTDRLKVIFCGSEVAMARDPEQKFEFRSMELETVDLLMTQDKTARHRIWVKKRPSYCAEAGVGRERLMRAYPGPDRPLGNVDVEALADRALGITEGVAEVIGRDCFEDHVLRIGFIFSCGCGEFIEALSALEYLEDSEAVLSPSFLDSEF